MGGGIIMGKRSYFRNLSRTSPEDKEWPRLCTLFGYVYYLSGESWYVLSYTLAQTSPLKTMMAKKSHMKKNTDYVMSPVSLITISF